MHVILFNFFLFVFPPVRLLPFKYPHPLFLLFPFFPFPPFFCLLPARGSSLENVTAAILSYAVSHLHEGTEKLRKTCADTVGHLTEFVPSLQSLKKWPPAQRFDMQAADRRSPIQVLTQRQAAWVGWPPGTGHLPYTECCRLHAILFHRRKLGLFNILSWPIANTCEKLVFLKNFTNNNQKLIKKYKLLPRE